MVTHPSTLQLRPASPSDLPWIQTWLQHYQLPTADLSESLGCLSLGIQADAIIGCGGIERHGDDGLLRSLVIAPPWQGQGYGQRLCRQLIHKAQLEGVRGLYLLTNTAPGFFAKLGFQPMERQLAPATLQQTTEFTSLCPAAAICMGLQLTGPDLPHPPD